MTKDQVAELREVLEGQYRLRAEQLAELMGRSASGDRDADPATTAGLTAACRRALAEVTRALRYLAEDRYGRCDGCGRTISMERLRALPQSRFCVPCQERQP